MYNHMWFDDEEWQCGGGPGFTSQLTRREFLGHYDARFVIDTQGPMDQALAYKRRVGNKMTWYSRLLPYRRREEWQDSPGATVLHPDGKPARHPDRAT